MSNKKCVIKINKNDAEEDTLMFPCFQIPSNIELKNIPSTGEEYLLTVINERNTCTKVTTCDIDRSKFAHKQTLFVKEDSHPKVPDSLKPTIEWQNVQVADFSDNRSYISRLLSKKSQWPKEVMRICLDPSKSEMWSNFFENHEPTLSCVLGLNYKILDSGLEYLIESLDNIQPGNTIPYRTGQWMYAILVCTRQPLLSDTVSILRRLGKKCAEIRANINPQDVDASTAATPLNVFICLIARYFGQFDLAD
ncbi:unnamed protein product [Leptosia nina]|uniref:Gem-associated protein 2 n=1 Tax=Leptosia nina TaxID=320188 RepID=A0AAV1IW22_9NEOP